MIRFRNTIYQADYNGFISLLFNYNFAHKKAQTNSIFLLGNDIFFVRMGFFSGKERCFNNFSYLYRFCWNFPDYFGGLGSYPCMATGLFGQAVLSFMVQPFVTLGQ